MNYQVQSAKNFVDTVLDNFGIRPATQVGSDLTFYCCGKSLFVVVTGSFVSKRMAAESICMKSSTSLKSQFSSCQAPLEILILQAVVQDRLFLRE